MNWSTAPDLKAQLERLWARGDLLRDLLTGTQRFPLRLSAKMPRSADVTERFEAVRLWASTLSATPHIRVDRQETRHRVHGTQQLPIAVWIDSLDDALAWLGKRRERDAFLALAAITTQQQPALVPWLQKRPLRALELAQDWPRLLAVVAWLRDHPQPGIYFRQVDLPGVHTKFIETHRATLAELLDLALPASAIDDSRSGLAQFAARYGFLDKPVHIRFRTLDPALQLLPGANRPDLALDANSFGRLQLDIDRVFITENETNFLAFPAFERAIVIFGAGYGWEALSHATWLRHLPIHYWGDIDTHGFAILAQLRKHFRHVESMLMDHATLNSHTHFWGQEDTPSAADCTLLTAEENLLYDDLRHGHIRPRLRLEQEHIRFNWLSDLLKSLRCASPALPQPDPTHPNRSS